MPGLCIQLTVLLPLLVHTHYAPSCGENQYPETSRGREVCCNFCAPGQEISVICVPGNSASKCKDCNAQYYNPKNTRNRCKRCTICDKGEGSIEIQPCTKTSNAECACPEGSTPRNEHKTACRCDIGKEIRNNKCQPCNSGYFSMKENSVCRPWTNCSAKGETVLEAGSATQDVKCTKPTNVTLDIPHQIVTQTLAHSSQRITIQPQVNATTIQRFKTDISSTEKTTESGFLAWGALSLILIGVILLSVSAVIIVIMIIQSNRKKRNRGFIRGERCKVPVQEESTSSDSSLAKQCPA
ncbi:tumor necrosis factor receptor superfamily member 4 [Pseudophryne corroboree]|uniref:tumor necrosis factor receptor superfamily member 4 n=1 Tax=Pseudophryne corroboree TaxID=495146 RepID=UPI0030817FEC